MAKEDDNISWLLGLGLFWFFIGRTVNSLVNLAFKITGIRLFSIDKDFTKINIDLAIKNTTGHTLTLHSIVCDMLFNGIKIADISQAVNRYIYRHDVTVITLQIQLYNNELTTQIVKQIESGIYDNFTIDLVGNVYVNSHRLPFNVRLLSDDIMN